MQIRPHADLFSSRSARMFDLVGEGLDDFRVGAGDNRRKLIERFLLRRPLDHEAVEAELHLAALFRASARTSSISSLTPSIELPLRKYQSECRAAMRRAAFELPP